MNTNNETLDSIWKNHNELRQNVKEFYVESKLDIHVLLDAYFTLNEDCTYDSEYDQAIREIADEWDYFKFRKEDVTLKARHTKEQDNE